MVCTFSKCFCVKGSRSIWNRDHMAPKAWNIYCLALCGVRGGVLLVPDINHLQSLERTISYTDLERSSVCVVKWKGTVPKCILDCEIQQYTVWCWRKKREGPACKPVLGMLLEKLAMSVTSRDFCGFCILNQVIVLPSQKKMSNNNKNNNGLNLERGCSSVGRVLA